MAQRSYSATAIAVTLSADINASVNSFAVTGTVTGYPTANFIITIDRGLGGEEKMLVGARSGGSFSEVTRAYDGTTATTHTAGAAIEHTIGAVDVSEANSHINDPALAVTQHSTLLDATRHAAISHTAAMLGTGSVGTDELIDGAVTDAKHSSTAWTAYTPTWTGGGSLGNGTLTGRYRQTGKRLKIAVRLIWGSTSTPGTGDWNFSLPAGFTAASDVVQVVAGSTLDASLSTFYSTNARINPGGGGFAVNGNDSGFQQGAGRPITWATSDEVNFSGEIETA